MLESKITIDPFLKMVKVQNEKDAMRNSLKAALQRNKTYVKDISQTDRQRFRSSWASLITESAKIYSTPLADDKQHCETIAKISEKLSQDYAHILVGGYLRFGTSQKAFNLYLKFLWRLDIENFPAPPHCPVDGVVLKAANLQGSWTKCNSVEQYMKWIAAIRKQLTIHSTLAEYEYDLWNKSARNQS